MLDSHYYLSQVGIQAENRALNTIINDLRQEVTDLNHQLILNNRLSEEQYTLIQNLTIEQKETKELIVDLKDTISRIKVDQNKIQEENFRCMR